VAGVTLGGGYGWLMRRHGLCIDNLLSAQLVAADGRLVTASAEENPELFWGVRGGGGNFGVVTELEFCLHPAGAVTGGMAFWPAHHAPRVLRAYRALMEGAPDDLCALCNLLRLPPVSFVPPPLVGAPVVAVAVCHLGGAEAARRDLAPLFSGAGPPLIDRIAPMPYARLQRMYDHAGTFGRRVHGRSGHLPALADAAVDAIAEAGADVPSPFSVVMVSSLGGAVARAGDDSTAFGRRSTPFDVAVTAVWTDPADTARQVAWVEDAWRALRPCARGVYVNELGDEGAERVREAYTPRAWRRLRALKAAWDPGNRFRLNQNIPPAA
jgi:FAD/FMN-containing dehydrogenase